MPGLNKVHKRFGPSRLSCGTFGGDKGRNVHDKDDEYRK